MLLFVPESKVTSLSLLVFSYTHHWISILITIVWNGFLQSDNITVSTEDLNVQSVASPITR